MTVINMKSPFTPIGSKLVCAITFFVFVTPFVVCNVHSAIGICSFRTGQKGVFFHVSAYAIKNSVLRLVHEGKIGNVAHLIFFCAGIFAYFFTRGYQISNENKKQNLIHGLLKTNVINLTIDYTKLFQNNQVKRKRWFLLMLRKQIKKRVLSIIT
jgi:hypothetical protein